MPKPSFYWKSTCTSCRDARSSLKGKGIEVDELNYAKTKLDEATVRRIVAAAGSVEAVLNRRHAIAKERGWAEQPPSRDDFVRAVLDEANLLRRPIFVDGLTVLVGFDKSNHATWDKLRK